MTLILVGAVLLSFNHYQLDIKSNTLNDEVVVLKQNTESLSNKNQELTTTNEKLNVSLEDEKSKPPVIVEKIVEVSKPQDNKSKYLEIAREEIIKTNIRNIFDNR